MCFVGLGRGRYHGEVDLQDGIHSLFVVGSVWESVELSFFAPRSSVLCRYHRGFVNYGYLQEGSSALNKGI